jgi:NAD(P)-dependent dehydrogenase (short-subunit alcohol dehydrogenase family)
MIFHLIKLKIKQQGDKVVKERYRMENEVAVVTGASSGFGLLTSLELAKNGFHVIATMRNEEKAVKLLELAVKMGCLERIQIQKLDVTSEESVNILKDILEQMGRVDVLVNNAGYAGAGFVEEIPIIEYRKQFDTNVFGPIMVSQACLPLMRKAGKGKIINVSSISGLIGFPGISPYVASKHALEGWSESLRLEMKPYGVYVCLIEPGSFKTNIWSTGKQVTEKSLKTDSPYFSYMQSIDAYINKGVNQFGNPQDVANKIVEIAQHSNPDLRYPIGKGVKLSLFLKRSFSWKKWESIFMKRLR